MDNSPAITLGLAINESQNRIDPGNVMWSLVGFFNHVVIIHENLILSRKFELTQQKKNVFSKERDYTGSSKLIFGAKSFFQILCS